jgi:hypothetical protein
MAYDRMRGVMVILICPQDQESPLQTWEYDGATWTRRALGSSESQSWRQNSSLAFDLDRNLMVMFGGQFAPEGPLGFQRISTETWEYDSKRWTLRADITGGPELVRGSATACFLPRRHHVFLVGENKYGQHEGWELFGTEWRKSPTTFDSVNLNGPASIAYNEQTRSPMMICGTQSTTSMWAFDTSTWRPIPRAQVVPARWYPYPAVYDSTRKRLVAFGGVVRYSSDGSIYRNPTRREFDGANWTEFPSKQVPFRGLMSYDRANDRVMLLGTSIAGSFESWEFDGQSWKKAAIVGNGPSTNYGNAIVYDQRRRKTIVVSASHSLTGVARVWEHDGFSWQRRTFDTLVGVPSAGASMIYDPDRGKVVMLGSPRPDAQPFVNLWEYDGVTWVLRSASGPVKRSNAACAYDIARKKIVLFSGISQTGNRLGDIWEWDGASWTLRTYTGESPPPLLWPAMVYDEARQVVVLVGTANGVDEQWEYDGMSWTKTAYPGGEAIAGRESNTMVYDSLRKRVVRQAGESVVPSDLLAGLETWTLSSRGVIPVGLPKGRQTVNLREPIDLSQAVDGLEPMVFRWKKNGVLLENSDRIAGIETAHLVVRGATWADAGRYSLSVRDACGNSVTGGEIAINIACHEGDCAGDFDGSGGVPDGTDIEEFLSAWLLTNQCAEVDASGGTPDSMDVEAFFAAWLVGC